MTSLRQKSCVCFVMFLINYLSGHASQLPILDATKKWNYSILVLNPIIHALMSLCRPFYLDKACSHNFNKFLWFIHIHWNLTCRKLHLVAQKFFSFRDVKLSPLIRSWLFYSKSSWLTDSTVSPDFNPSKLASRFGICLINFIISKRTSMQ